MPFCVTLAQARPFAPSPVTKAVSSSMPLRENLSAAPSAQMPFTIPPVATAPENTLKSLVFACSVQSISVMPKRRSGLSQPYFSIDSL